MGIMVSSAPAGAVRITLVPSPACHYCEDAIRALTELASEYTFEFEQVPLESNEGRRLVALHRPALAPLVLIDGRFFSSGRMPRKKLARLLAELAERAEVIGVGRDAG
jgi:hypothetical protein